MLQLSLGILSRSGKIEDSQGTRPRLDSFLSCTQVQKTANWRLELLLGLLRAAGPLVNKRASAGEKHWGAVGAPSASFATPGVTQVLLLPPRGLVETLPLTSLLSCATLAARPGNWDPAEHRGSRLGRTQYGSVGRTTFTLQERSLLRASRVCTPGLISTATLPSRIRGGCSNGNNSSNSNGNNRSSNSNNNSPSR